jgi:hypothetical protein
MKKMFSHTLKPAKPAKGKVPSDTDTPQQKVGSPVPEGEDFRHVKGGVPEKQPAPKQRPPLTK